MKLGSFALAIALHGGSIVAARPEDNGQPKEIRSTGGVLEVTLDVDLVTTEELNGRVSPGYNNGPVGPTLRANPGDKVRITLVNNLEPSPADEVELMGFAMTPVIDDPAKEVNQTLLVNRLNYPTGNIWTLAQEEYWGHSFQNLHFHGLMVDPHIDDSRRYIDGGGQEMVYEFEIPSGSPPLFGFYHNHVHGTASYSSLSGLVGLFVIDDPTEVTSSKEQFLILSETSNYKDGTPKDFHSIVMDFDWDHVTNGQLKPTMTFKKGETVRFRAVNAGIEPAMTLSVENHMVTPTHMDGYPVPNPASSESVTLDAGVRAEFEVKFDTPGEYKFKRAAWHAGVTGPVCMAVFELDVENCISYDKETDVGVIVVLDEAADVDPSDVISDPTDSAAKPAKRSLEPQMHPFLQELLTLPSAGSRLITFDQTDKFPIFQIPYDGPFVPPGAGMGVNELLFNPHYFHGDITGGTCEEWTVVSNAQPPIHPFHIHSVPFYVNSLNGVELNKADRFWRDTMVTGDNFTATVCFPSRETESYINVHCHMPIHQDIGMAAFYKLLPDIEATIEESSASHLKATVLALAFVFSALVFI